MIDQRRLALGHFDGWEMNGRSCGFGGGSFLSSFSFGGGSRSPGGSHDEGLQNVRDDFVTSEVKKKENMPLDEIYHCSRVCTINCIWKFEMKVSHTNVELYRHTSDRSRIRKKMGAMPKKMGALIKHFYSNKTHTWTRERTTAEEENLQ